MHPIVHRWLLKRMHGRLGCTGARGCGGRRLCLLPSQKEDDCDDGDGNCYYATDDATDNGACI
jgi:hypothetical protein